MLLVKLTLPPSVAALNLSMVRCVHAPNIRVMASR